MPTVRTIAANSPHQPIDVERARQHALFTLRRAFATADVEVAADAASAVIAPTPFEVYDLNDQLLFYLFSVRVPGESRRGWVRAAADELVGTPILAIEVPRTPWDPTYAMERARERAQARFPTGSIGDVQLVCYSYPKIGVRVALGGAGRRSVIYDAVSMAEVPTLGPGEPEGFTAWSFYQTIAEPRAVERLLLFRQADRELEAAREEIPEMFAENFDEAGLSLMTQALANQLDVDVGPTSSRILQYSPRCSTHDCFALYSQQTEVFCAVATAQMILDFYRYNFTQVAIAAEMGTGPKGTENPAQRAGYESLSKHGLVATFDSTATWAEAKAEIDANRPVKSGIEGHARACSGWMRENASLSGRPPRKWLRIYDPWPSNPDPCAGGTILWEDWDAIKHTNFIYVRHA
jgi:hypothetical protein